VTSDDLDGTTTAASSQAPAPSSGERRRGGDRRAPAGPLGYGNIYTPHAGSMIIQVQRESGLQSRTIVLSPRQVRVLRFFTSRTGKGLAGVVITVIALLAVQAARVPSLTFQISRMQHTAQRLDTLEHSLAQLQKRYNQVRTMMGVDSSGATESATANVPGFAPASSIPRGGGAPVGIVSATDADMGAAGSDSVVANTTAAAVAHPRSRRRRPATPPPAAAAAEPAPTVVEPPPPDSGAPPSPQADQQ
jgi:hypothetical protein